MSFERKTPPTESVKSAEKSKKMMIIFGGTDMTWEDNAVFLQLGMTDVHNLRDEKAEHYYYNFNGPSAAVSDQHLPVERLRFDVDKPDYASSHPRELQNEAGYRWRWARGKGINHIVGAACELILHMVFKKNIQEFDLFGFSRGGHEALLVGSKLQKLRNDKEFLKLLSADDLKKFDAAILNIFAADPVAGKSRNFAAWRKGEMSSLVKKCILQLAVNEAVPGFRPRDPLSTERRYRVKMHKSTKFVVLPSPEDHAMAVQWMRDIVRQQIPSNSPLLKPCDDERMIERRLGLKEVKWEDRVDETRAYRLVHFYKHKPRYLKEVLPVDATGQFDLKKGIETFYKSYEVQRLKVSLNHVSLQNEADTEEKDRTYKGKPIGGRQAATKKTQAMGAKHSVSSLNPFLHQRPVKKNLYKYTNTFFVNLMHEAMFQKAYPDIHAYLSQPNAKNLNKALAEFNAISKKDCPKTAEIIQQAIALAIKGEFKLKSIKAFGATNMESLQDVFELIIPTKCLRADLQEIKEIKSDKDKKHTVAITVAQGVSELARQTLFAHLPKDKESKGNTVTHTMSLTG